MLRVIEGFDFMPSGLSDSERGRLFAAKRYYPVSTFGGVYPQVGTGRFGFGKCLDLSINNIGVTNIGTKIPIPGSAISEGFFGTAVYVGSNHQGSNGNLIKLHDGYTDTPQLTFSMETNGVISVYRGDYPGGALLGHTAPASYQENEWWHLGGYAKIDSTAGQVELRVNTETKLSFVSANTKGVGSTGTFDMIYPSSQEGSGNAYHTYLLDDLYLNDTTGGRNDIWLGNCRVMTQFVTGNSTPQDFAIGGSAPAATAWQSVLNQNLDDTKFIIDGTVGHRSLFTLEAIINAPMVFGVQLAIAARMDDATQRVMGNVMKSGSSVMTSADEYINQTYTFYQNIKEINAATGVGFTGAELNALLVGPNVNA